MITFSVVKCLIQLCSHSNNTMILKLLENESRQYKTFYQRVVLYSLVKRLLQHVTCNVLPMPNQKSQKNETYFYKTFYREKLTFFVRKCFRTSCAVHYQTCPKSMNVIYTLSKMKLNVTKHSIKEFQHFLWQKVL